jgi:outer membrane protein
MKSLVKTFRHASIHLLALALIAPALFAQDAAPTQAATQSNQPAPVASIQTASQAVVPVERVGVDTSKRVTLTLRDAVMMALENNRDIEIERENVRMTEADLRAAQGFYDPTFVSSLAYQRSTLPVANLVGGGQSTGIVGSATVAQRLPGQGGSVEAFFDNSRATSDQLFNNLNPQYSATFGLTFTQPLFRNREIDPARRQIRLAKKRLDISDSQFRQRAIEIITGVQRAYWDLVFARRDHEIKREALSIGQTQLGHNQRLVEAGTLAPADVIATRVEVERRTDELEAATEAIQRAENALKSLMLQPSNTELWSSVIETTEQPQVGPDASLPLQDALALAFKNRPELVQFQLRGELNRVDVDYFRNQTKPQIDFFASYSTAGLAGSVRPEPLPFLVNGQPIPRAVPDQFIGGYGQSLANLFRNEFRTYRVGVNVSLPFRNRTAKAQLDRSLAEGRQIDVQQQRTMQGVEIEVRNALQAVQTARRRVEAAKNSRENAELQLQSEQRKFDAGQSTNFFVLDRQNALSAAQGRELRALTDYNKAVAELQRAIATTLTVNNVAINSADVQK